LLRPGALIWEHYGALKAGESTRTPVFRLDLFGLFAIAIDFTRCNRGLQQVLSDILRRLSGSEE
jgi:hypothetical protein